jgi:hypothetical protein
MVSAMLAASYGHLGRGDEAREALARYRALTDMPLEAIAAMTVNEDHRKQFLDGIVLARGGVT